MAMTPRPSTIDLLNKLCKWRSILAGWHGGTSSINSPGTQAMRDLMDKWLIMRVESSAVMALLIDKGLVTREEAERQIAAEAMHLDNKMEEQFPGMKTNVMGVDFYDIALANATMQRLGFPP